jgi:hypothetical protein
MLAHGVSVLTASEEPESVEEKLKGSLYGWIHADAYLLLGLSECSLDKKEEVVAAQACVERLRMNLMRLASVNMIDGLLTTAYNGVIRNVCGVSADDDDCGRGRDGIG